MKSLRIKNDEKRNNQTRKGNERYNYISLGE